MITLKRDKEIENYSYNEDLKPDAIVSSLKFSEELHHSFSYYNWDDGFEFPSLILQRLDCDLGTIRLILLLGVQILLEQMV